ncbi:hypothetical protein LWI28_008226 [Acer negundo]|uniref:Uncharacterized protein n=1 Tax=Acer negundo TaxID=4023 RepID=A0AAD5ID22_ACENE|nr:hypothetical protein LWI28_008226 [Acer negundo]
MEKDRIFKGSECILFSKEGWSYADVVKKVMPRKTEVDKGISMTWSTSNVEYNLLSKSAIRVLRNFSSVELVNQKLEDRGFGFSSTVIGGKKKLLGRLKLLVTGKCKAFFKNLGDLVKEMLWIDEDTEFHQRMDVGRMLVLSLVGESLSMEVVVKVGELSTLSSDHEIGHWAYSKKFRGECSKGLERWWKDNGPRGGPIVIGSPVGSFEALGQHGYKKALVQSDASNEALKDSSPISGALAGKREERSYKEATQKSFGSKEQESIQVVLETQVESDKGIELMVDLRNQGGSMEYRYSDKEKMTVEELSRQSYENQNWIGVLQAKNERNQSGGTKSRVVKNPRGKNNYSSVNIHPMITRGLTANSDNGFKGKTRRVIWNLEEEIKKVIEKRATRSLYRNAIALRATIGEPLDPVMGIKNLVRGNSWNTEEKVAKVVETGVALGFDYNGYENEIVEYLSLREREDEVREDE